MSQGKFGFFFGSRSDAECQIGRAPGEVRITASLFWETPTMNTFSHLLSRLRSTFQTGSRRRATDSVPAPDQLFSTRLRAGGATRFFPPAEVDGFVSPAPRVRIPFQLRAGDTQVKVVAFSDPPGLLTLAVEAPSGTLLGGSAALASHVRWQQHGAMVTCDFDLPLPESAGETAGTWHAVLQVDQARFKLYLQQLRVRFPREFERLAASGVYYSVSALASRRAPSPSFFPSRARRPELALPLP